MSCPVLPGVHADCPLISNANSPTTYNSSPSTIYYKLSESCQSDTKPSWLLVSRIPCRVGMICPRFPKLKPTRGSLNSLLSLDTDHCFKCLHQEPVSLITYAWLACTFWPVCAKKRSSITKCRMVRCKLLHEAAGPSARCKRSLPSAMSYTHGPLSHR